MSSANTATNDVQELSRRRTLMVARRNREAERASLLSKIIETERNAFELREWVNLQETRTGTLTSEMQHLLDWAKVHLSEMDRFLAPAELSQLLVTLFPEIDDLVDPLGDPAPLRPWAR